MTNQRTNKLFGNKNLSYKIISAIMLGMGLLVTLMIVVFSYSFHILEHGLMREHNQAELVRIHDELSKNADYPLPQTAKLKIYKSNADRTDIPDYLASLPAGFNDEIRNEGDYYYVSVGWFDEQYLYVVNDISKFEESENTFETIVLITWVILITLIFALSYQLSHFLLKPISDFADEFDELKPQERGHKFSGKYRGLEVEKMARSVDRYLDKMDEYVERQHSFAAMASHELRTPLTVIQTSAELIGAQAKDESIHEQCSKISRSSAKMSDMILALLSITRDQPANQQDTDKIVLYEAVQEALQNLQHEISVNSITIINQVPTDTLLFCNDVLLSVVINNLLTNAIKHSPKGTIHISYANHGLSIVDNGEGLGSANINKLFRKGVAGKNNGGYGLGLYITQLICDKQGWTLQLQNANPGTRAQINFT